MTKLSDIKFIVRAEDGKKECRMTMEEILELVRPVRGAGLPRKRRHEDRLVRSLLYRLARILGDIQAARRGRLAQRLHNRMIGRMANKVLRRFWR